MKMDKRPPDYFAAPIEVSEATRAFIKELQDVVDELRRPVAYSEPMIEGL